MKKIMVVCGVSCRAQTRASGQMEITTNPSPRSPRDDCPPCLGREGHLPRCRLRVRPASAPISLGHDRRGVGGTRPAGASGDGRAAQGPGRTSDGASAAGRGGRDPLPGPVRGGMAGVAGGLPAMAGGVRVLRAVVRAGSAPAVGRPAARAATGGSRPSRVADRGGDRCPVGQGRGHRRGRYQRI